MRRYKALIWPDSNEIHAVEFAREGESIGSGRFICVYPPSPNEPEYSIFLWAKDELDAWVAARQFIADDPDWRER